MADDKATPYFRTVVTVEVLSDEPLKFDTLADLHEQITWGHKSGRAHIFAEDKVDRRTMRQMLVAQGSDPDFFDVDGETYDDDDGLVTSPHYIRDTYNDTE